MGPVQNEEGKIPLLFDHLAPRLAKQAFQMRTVEIVAGENGGSFRRRSQKSSALRAVALLPLRDRQIQSDTKTGASAGIAAFGEAAAHRLGKAARYDESQSGAPVAPRVRTIPLGKRLKKLTPRPLIDPFSSVLNNDDELHTRGRDGAPSAVPIRNGV